MNYLKSFFRNVSFIAQYRFQLVFILASTWTLVEAISLIKQLKEQRFEAHSLNALLSQTHGYVLHLLLIFLMSCFLAYVLMFYLDKIFREYSLWVSFFLKTIILIVGILFLNFFSVFAQALLISRAQISTSIQIFMKTAFEPKWLLNRVWDWLVIFLISQLILQINAKYSPGFFFDILLGKYRKPHLERRIVMFIDLKDSTPIAEQLGSKEYFLFIKDFISAISLALLQNNGSIYQYVGDEIVVSWVNNKRNRKKWLDAILDGRRNLQKKGVYFQNKYNILPEFRIGIHLGEVTVGEIGLIKKDLAMSGDTMNTAARIRSACSGLGQKFIVSKQFIDEMDLEEWQYESLGIIELKGKQKGLELFALKI